MNTWIIRLAASSVLLTLLGSVGREKGVFQTARFVLGLVFLLLVMEPAARLLSGGIR